MEALYICGHQNPDTDSIVAAISYASLKREMGEPDALAVRLGSIGAETSFVLERFGFHQPVLLPSARTQLKDIHFDLPKTVLPTVTIREAWETMLSNKLRSLPVVGEEGQLLGICTSSDIVDFEMASSDKNYTITTSVNNLCKVLSGWCISGCNSEVSGQVRTSLGDRDFTTQTGILIAEWRKGIENIVANGTASAVILCQAYDAVTVDGNLPVIATPFDVYTVSRLISHSMQVSTIMKSDNLITFLLDDYVDDVRKVLISTRHHSYPVLNSEGRVVGAISRIHLINYRKKRMVLVDHNEKSQSAPGLEQAEVVEVVDHHRLGDVQTSAPVLFRNEPVGSTTTIVASIYQEQGRTPSQEMAGLMLAGILSDTVIFKSPTSTSKDRQMAEWLAGIAKQDTAELGRELFNAITNALVKKNPEELLFYDFKEYLLGGKKIGIGQITCWDADNIPTADIRNAMEKLRTVERFDMVLFMQTEIIRNGSTLLNTGADMDLLLNAFGLRDSREKTEDLFLDGVMSRKKQLVPALSAYLL